MGRGEGLFKRYSQTGVMACAWPRFGQSVASAIRKNAVKPRVSAIEANDWNKRTVFICKRVGLSFELRSRTEGTAFAANRLAIFWRAIMSGIDLVLEHWLDTTPRRASAVSRKRGRRQNIKTTVP